MKKASILLGVFAALLVYGSTLTNAAPNPENPNKIVFHNWTTDTGETIYPLPVLAEEGEEGYWKFLYGYDLVMWRGRSGKIHQWFISEDETIGFHSVWNPMNDNQNCPVENGNAVIINPGWGDYTHPEADIHFPEEDTDYCVITNEFGGKIPGAWLRYIAETYGV